MIWLLTRPIVWPLKTAGYSAAAGYKTGRLVGYRRIFVFGLGVVVGVLLSNKELRDTIVEKVTGGGAIAELPPAPVTTPRSPAAATEVVDLTEPTT